MSPTKFASRQTSCRRGQYICTQGGRASRRCSESECAFGSGRARPANSPDLCIARGVDQADMHIGPGAACRNAATIAPQRGPALGVTRMPDIARGRVPGINRYRSSPMVAVLAGTMRVLSVVLGGLGRLSLLTITRARRGLSDPSHLGTLSEQWRADIQARGTD